MRQIDWKLVPEHGRMVLLTIQDLVDEVPLMIADFRDTHALFHPKSGRFLGLTRNRGMRMGKSPIQMIDGIWYINEDDEIAEKFKDLEVKSEDLILKVIE
jgi:hypothetical protein